jgi:hypothetical protein
MERPTTSKRMIKAKPAKGKLVIPKQTKVEDV